MEVADPRTLPPGHATVSEVLSFTFSLNFDKLEIFEIHPKGAQTRGPPPPGYATVSEILPFTLFLNSDKLEIFEILPKYFLMLLKNITKIYCNCFMHIYR